MSPAPPPRPPRRDEPEHPAERGIPQGRPPQGKPGAPPPRGAPGKPPAKPAAPPPPPPKPNPVARAGKFFEVRKGRAGATGEEEEEVQAPEEIALPRSITQEQEEADLKRRLNREELIEIDKRHSAVKMVGVASEPTALRRKSGGVWLLVLVVLAAIGLFLADKYKLVNFGAQSPQQAPPK